MFRKPKRSATDFSSELQSHIALEADRLRAEEGVSEEEAYARANRTFGNIHCYKERYYESNRTLWLDHLRQDAGYAFRQLARNKPFALVAIVTLALGIGANTAIFTLVHAVMFNSLPVNRPGELYRLGQGDNCCEMTGYQNGQDFGLFSYDLYRTLRDGTPEIKHLAAFQADPQVVNVRRSGSSEPGRPLKSEYVSSNYFDLFGVRPAQGSFFNAGNEVRGSAPAVVLSYRAWRTYFGGDSGIVGSTLLIKGKPFTAIGIAPPSFYGETLRSDPPDAWLPVATEPLIAETNNLFDRHGKLWLYLMGRVAPGTPRGALESKINVEAKRWFYDLAGPKPSVKQKHDIEDQFIPLTSASGGPGVMNVKYRDGLVLLMSLSSLVLLIACANVANLLLARGAAMRAQISLKLALGASRGRVARQALTDSVILSLLGGTAGLAVAFAATRLIVLLAFRGARYVPIDAMPSLPVLAFAIGVSVATGLLFGLAPAWIETRSDPAEALRGASRSTPAAAMRPQRVLVIAQTALSFVLLAGAGLMTQSLRNLQGQNFGFQTDRRIVVKVDPAFTGYTAERLARTYRRVQERLARIPGVIGASLSMYLPMTGNNWCDYIWVEGTGAARQPGTVYYDRIAPRYFETIGTRLLQGRSIDEHDLPSSRRIAVVNETFATRYFKGKNPLGGRFGAGGPEHASDYEIVGLVEDAKYDSTYRPAYPTFFLPLFQMEENSNGTLSRDNFVTNIALHVDRGPGNLEPLIRTAIAEVDSNLAVLDVLSYGEQLAQQFNRERLIATLTQLFGMLALALASIGLYGLIALSVARRTAEIGVRIALGATRNEVVSMILRGAIVQIGVGIAIGIPASLAVARLIQHQLFGVSAYDPAAMIGATVLLTVCAIMAGFVPARRAALVDPMVALRVE